jgi:hypothetical protein
LVTWNTLPRRRVIQGSQDKVVPPVRTQRLISRFVNRVEYHELDAGHDLVDPGSGAWDQVKERVLIFAASLLTKIIPTTSSLGTFPL